MTTNDYTAIFRTIAYLWIAGEFTSLANLYQYGYDEYKRTPIIFALQRLLTFLGVFFAFLAFLPVIRIYSWDAFESLVNVGLLLLIPLGLYSRRFRQQSLKKQNMELPNVPKESGTISGKVKK